MRIGCEEDVGADPTDSAAGQSHILTGDSALAPFLTERCTQKLKIQKGCAVSGLNYAASKSEVYDLDWLDL